MIGLATLLVVAIVVAVKGETIFSPGGLNADSRGPRLGGVASHAEIGNQCSACHAAPWSNQNMAGRCLQCHADVSTQLDGKTAMHGLLANGRQCRSCHSEHQGEHAALTDMSKFDHDFAAFKLTGKHRAAECQSCHVNNVFKGTSQSCVGCHEEPMVHKGQFGTDCASCHSTNTWKDSVMSLAKLGKFDHDRTGFKLTGKHLSVECQACHANNLFKGTLQTCVSCHAEPAVPKVHHFRYGTGCASCHTTATWADNTFKHTAFSISHGRRNNTCATCHNDTDHFEKYTCYTCHEHEKSRMERIHARRKVANLDACIDCHGRKRRVDFGDLDDRRSPAASMRSLDPASYQALEEILMRP
jgi:hypothetical protein